MNPGALRKVLLIAYSFPPVGIRSHRAVKFAKYLHRHGWWPVVLTPSSPYAPDMDPALAKEVAGYQATIYRTGSWEPVALIKRLKGERGDGAAAPRQAAWWGARMAKWLRANCVIPDYRIGWVPWAVAAGLRIICRERIHVIMVTVEPHSSLLAAALLKWLTGKPLVMDFRDEWTPLARYRDPEKLGMVIAFEAWLERRLVAAADVVTTVTPAVRDNFRRRFPQMAEKFLCIPNGWDPEDFDALPPAPPSDGRLTVTHAGTLYEGRFPEGFFTALRQVLQEDPARQSRIRVRLIGSIAPEVRDYLRRYPYPDVIDCPGQMGSREALRWLRASDVLLLQEESDPDVAQRYVPSKLYDYLGAERFVLALAGAGMIREIVETARVGVAIDPADVPAIRAVLLERLQTGRTEPSPEDRAQRLQWARTVQTGTLAGVLDQLADGKAAEAGHG